MAKTVDRSGVDMAISDAELKKLVREALEKTGKNLDRVLVLPPDGTRLNSYAGPITAMIYEILSPKSRVDIMPALGTHFPMTEHEIRTMFGPTIPLDRFLVHDWRNEVKTVGTIPGNKIREWSEGKVDYDVCAQANRALWNDYDLIVSVGQIVPHEVVGMANYTKNIMVGVGGSDMINKSHFLGAVYNMERIMGRPDTPVRKLFNYGVRTFLSDLSICYFLTVMARNPQKGKMEMRGFFAGDDDEAFLAGSRLSQQVNLELLKKPLKKVVVYLDPEEFKSTWLGNKSVYRTRMAIADDGELIVLAPGLREFGEDREIDKLIRKYGYFGTPKTLDAVRDNEDIRNNLGAAAHLIHGSSEGRFSITYCPGPGMPKSELERAGFRAADLEETMKRLRFDTLKDGFNRVDGEEIFYISNPALGLWALKRNFDA
jgi:nickel-dependent lactate racemase